MNTPAATETHFGPLRLVAIFCAVPVLAGTLADALERIATLLPRPAGRPDPEGVLTVFPPDDFVVDDIRQEGAVRAFAEWTGAPVLELRYERPGARMLKGGTWRDVARGDASGGTLRNPLIGHVFAWGARR